MLATDIRSMVDLAYQDLGTPVQERFAVQHFIDAFIFYAIKMTGCTLGGKNPALLMMPFPSQEN